MTNSTFLYSYLKRGWDRSIGERCYKRDCHMWTFNPCLCNLVLIISKIKMTCFFSGTISFKVERNLSFNFLILKGTLWGILSLTHEVTTILVYLNKKNLNPYIASDSLLAKCLIISLNLSGWSGHSTEMSNYCVWDASGCDNKWTESHTYHSGSNIGNFDPLPSWQSI